MDQSVMVPPQVMGMPFVFVIWMMCGLCMAYNDKGNDTTSFGLHLFWVVIDLYMCHFECFDCLEDDQRMALTKKCAVHDIVIITVKLFVVYLIKGDGLSEMSICVLALAIYSAWKWRSDTIKKFIKSCNDENGDRGQDDDTKKCKRDNFFRAYVVVLVVFSYSGNQMFAGLNHNVTTFQQSIPVPQTWSPTIIMVTALTVLFFSICVVCGSSLLPFINQMWNRKEEKENDFETFKVDMTKKCQKMDEERQKFELEYKLHEQQLAFDQLKMQIKARQQVQVALPPPQQQVQEVPQQQTDLEQFMIQEFAKINSQLSRMDTIESSVTALYATNTARTDKKTRPK